MRKRIMAVTCAALIGAMALTGCGKKADDTNTQDTQQTETAVEKVTPTLMYFISNSDETLDAEKTVIEELEAEYGDDVNFNVINIDENTEAANNFPVQGNTPMVIMLNTTNDISAMSPKTSDKDGLKDIIDAALKD